MNFDLSRAVEVWSSAFGPMLLATLKVTIPLSLIAFAISLVLAVLAASARLSRFRPLKALAWLYVWVFRGTPLLVQLFIVFYGLPKLFPSLVLDPWTAAVGTLALNCGAYASEAVRASILSIPRGQYEAAATLDLDRRTTFFKVIAPQAFRIALPPLSNDFIDLVKGTSLVSTITLLDMFMVAQQRAAATFEPFYLYILVAAIYLVLVSALSLLQAWLEKKASVYVERD
ncbi:amino acid ABC transporter permease [Dermabacter hominis]|uniref:amino acid ABC transporter permease n=1 Tax=Dermabacter hominis TaxID=36740 RepID=UPI00223ADAF0|nr:amino acid ABC transporter permease [Dermabacter hominis]MCT2024477.1 amino acid ABC transporter permease [Dermabacter hominis]